MSSPSQQAAARSFTTIAPYYDRLMASVPYRFWGTYIEALWRTHGCKPTRMLDLACGTGTMSLMFAAKGMDVVGVDLSAEMIDVAQQKAQEQGLQIEFKVADASHMEPISPAVDTAICLFDSLNNIIDPELLGKALSNVRQSLADGGYFIFDLNTSYAFRQGMFNQRSSPMDEPLNYVWRSKYDEPSRLCTVTMEFTISAHEDKPKQEFTEVHVQRAYSRMEIEEMLLASGFEEITPYDAYTLFKPKKRSDRIFWVAR